MRKASFVFRLLGVALLAVVLPALLAWSAEPAKKAPQVDPAVQDLVQGALQSEAAGDNHGRAENLQKAVSQSPQDAATHWQLGQVWIDGKWLTPDQAQKFAAGDKRLAQYRTLRNRSVLTVDSQAALARWCRKNKLADEERVHWQIVLQLQPGNPEAIQGLGLKPYAGMLLTQSQIQQVKVQVQKLGKAVDRWRPLVVQWRNAVTRHQTAPPVEVRDTLTKTSNRTEMVALERTLWQEVGAKRHKEAYHVMLLSIVEMLAGNPHPPAAESLVRLAVFSAAEDVRTAAIKALKKHSLDHFAPLLLSGLHMPIEPEARYALAANGDLISRHSLFQEGALVNQSLGQTFSPLMDPASSQPIFVSVAPGTGTMRFDNAENALVFRTYAPGLVASLEAQAAADRKSLPGQIAAANAQNDLAARANHQLNVQKSQGQALQNDAALQDAVGRANAAIAQQNARIEAVLCETTGQDLGDAPMKWWAWWWQDYNESYHVTSGTDQSEEGQPPKPEYHSEELIQYQGSAPTYSMQTTAGRGPVVCSCFAPGTKVWTLTGRPAIEKIKVGDRVLAQDVETGQLAYKPVLAVTTRVPGPRMSIRVAADTITATPSHPFWVAGQGWQMTKQLAAGSRLHTLSGAAAVETIEKLPIDPSYQGMAYNLIVADFDSYFVGDSAILVHDNTPRQPTSAVLPGLVK